MNEHTMITFRSIERGDVERLRAFINALSKEQTYIMYQGRQLSFEEEERYVEQFMRDVQSGNAVKVLAFAGEALVGVADVVRSLYETEHHVCTFGITVAKEWRGKGIGSKLMDNVLSLIPTEMPGIEIVRLGVFANNPVAKQMYERKGFVQYGTLPNGLLHKGVEVDHLFMYKRI